MDDIRGELRTWLEKNWDPELSLREWRELLVSSGWAAPSWPTDYYGLGLPAEADGILAQELTHAGAVGTPTGESMALAATTLLQHGSDELKRTLLRPILTGEHTWCQLF